MLQNKLIPLLMISNKIKIREILGGRLDPQFFSPMLMDIVDLIKSSNHKQLSKLARFSDETWNQKDHFKDKFPYIEIGAIDTLSGSIIDISQISKKDAPSRAKKIIRNNDIIVSTTRPSRGAISLVKTENIYIASTGFSVIRNISDEILREYLFIVLRQEYCLSQMFQRSSGGNYPAITEDELKKISIPLPSKEIQQKVVDIYTKAIQEKQEKEQKAKSLLDGIDGYLLKELGVLTPKREEHQQFFTIKISEIIGQRLDVSFYKKKFELISSKYENKKLYQIAHVNPSVSFANLSKKDEITFVPMEVIDEVRGEIIGDRSTTVSNIKGFTKFAENDLLWAKITPCMQNGKSAIARNLINGLGCGSTEFYVIRPKDDSEISIDYLYNLLRMRYVLDAAKESFGGSAGQQRVSSDYLKSIKIPMPSIEKQDDIVNTIIIFKAEAQKLQKEGSELINRAKKDIERIILG